MPPKDVFRQKTGGKETGAGRETGADAPSSCHAVQTDIPCLHDPEPTHSKEFSVKGDAISLLEYMSSKKRFVIPVYQRNYDWKNEQCKQLFDDLVRLKTSGRKSHFFGCIVSFYDAEADSEQFLIIDGQQRLTTVSLLLLALHDLLASGELVSDSPHLASMIQEEYLINKWKSNDTRIKLKPVKNDQKAFQKLFESPADHIRDSNLTVNYDYFCKRLREKTLPVDALFDALKRLVIIHIRLSASEDDPQLIFESLNSTGLALSEGDKIRNFILMGLDSLTQETFYEQYWNNIEECTRYDVSAFVRDFLSIKQQVTPVISKTYLAFKEYVYKTWPSPSRHDIEELLKDLLTYARYYRLLLTGGTKSRTLNDCIFRLNWLESTVSRPFLLEILRLHEQEKSLSLADIETIFQIIESFLFRRIICEVPANSLNKIFLTLHKEILRFDGTAAQYVEKLKYVLSVRRESGRFPDDEEFGAAFTTRNIYQMKAKNKTYLFERLENHGTLETRDVWQHLTDGDYSIEHIMPQTLSPEWKKHLGPDAEHIHAAWLHRIANLTTVAKSYNSAYSNLSFTDKRDVKNGFRDSGLRMNQLIAQKHAWGTAELEERSEALLQQALHIWPRCESTFRPKEKQLELCDLGEDRNLTGRQLVAFRWRGEEHCTSQWSEMYQNILSWLHADDPSVLLRLTQSADSDALLGNAVAAAKPDERSGVEIAPDIWLLTHMSTQAKIVRLRRFFQLYGVDEGELVFSLKEESEQPLNEAARYTTRRRYWEYALEILRESHTDGPFRHAAASRRNYLGASLGYAGIQILCVANQDEARVELYLGSGKERNKRIFDLLHAHRADIEKETGVLQWKRNSELKHSSVVLVLGGVSIYHEADWERIAQFHAHGSLSFCRAFLPLLHDIAG